MLLSSATAEAQLAIFDDFSGSEIHHFYFQL